MNKPIVDVHGLSKRYQLGAIGTTSLRDQLPRLWTRRTTATTEFWALRDVSFAVQRGEVVGIIGRNGAGKSTLLKILSRITRQTRGEVTLRGRVASLLEVGTGFHPELTGRENVFLNGAILGMTKAEIRRKFDEIVAFSEIEAFIDTPVKRYSSGMYVRLAFAVAAHLEPEILIVDEVLAVGDVAFQRKCLGKVGAISSEGRTVLLVSHNLLVVQSLCPRAILLDGGTLRADGPSAATVNQYLVDSSAAYAQIALRDRADRTGSGAVRFVGVELENGERARVDAVRSGETATFRLNFENIVGRDLHHVRIGLGVDDAFGQRITLFTTDADPRVPAVVPRSAKAVEIRAHRLPLAPGRYTFTLHFAVNGVVADAIENAGTFDVDPGDFYRTGKLPAGQGQFFVDHSFNVVTADNEPAVAAPLASGL